MVLRVSRHVTRPARGLVVPYFREDGAGGEETYHEGWMGL